MNTTIKPSLVYALSFQTGINQVQVVDGHNKVTDLFCLQSRPTKSLLKDIITRFEPGGCPTFTTIQMVNSYSQTTDFRSMIEGVLYREAFKSDF